MLEKLHCMDFGSLQHALVAFGCINPEKDLYSINFVINSAKAK
jgi:hypothetical protein